MAKQKESKQKKMNVRVDFTPMVDMMMLLITFFMLCTSLAKPQTMELSMPSNDKNQTDEDKSVSKASYTITIYVGADDQIYYIAGLPKYDDPTCLKKTTWGKDGIRKVLISHVTEDGTQPVQQVMLAKAKLDEKKLADPTYPDSIYNKELSKIKAGEIDGQKIYLNHYPFLCYGGAYEGVWQLFGHVHTSPYSSGKDTPRLNMLFPFQYDVGVDNNDFAPVHFDRIKEIMSFLLA